jgi:SSS family solute:Na+ symporter/sodium/proline symporter
MISQYIILGAYILFLIGVTIYFSFRKTKTTNEFFLGGRKIGAWMTAFAYGTTYFSAVMFVGYAGNFGWSIGLSATWIGIANALVGTLLAWKLLAKPTREITHRLDAPTMPDFFLKRYNSKGLKIASALIIFVFMVPYCASVYTGLSSFFTSVFGLPYQWCLVGMAVFTGMYLLVGGYIAAALIDFVQGLIMIVGVVLMISFVVGSPVVGGLSEGLSKIAALPDVGASLASPFPSAGSVVLLISLIILTSLGTWGLPQMVHKFYAIKDNKAIKRGTVISTLFALVVGGIAYFSGTFGRLFLNNTMPEGGVNAIMPEVMTAALPSVLLGVILVLILAASMSTLSSLVLVSSSSISMDLIKGVIKPSIKEKNAMIWMRALCGVFIAVSLVIALFPTPIVTLMSYSWGALAGCFLGPFLYGVRWKGMTKAGAWAGVISGLAITIPLIVLSMIGGILPKWLSAPVLGSMAMLASLVVTPVVSLLSKKFDAAHITAVFGEGNIKAVSEGGSAQA